MKKQLFFIAIFIIVVNNLIAQTIVGVDVSALQGTINWTQVYAAGKTFAFVKATKGTCYTDGQFINNMTNANSAGIVTGAYDFALPEDYSATAEANYFLSVASSYIGTGHLPPVLDMEDPAGTCIINSQPLSSYFTSSALTSWVQTWMTTVQNATGIAPILYVDANYAGYLNSSLNGYKLWIADPGTSPTTPPTNIGNWTTWTFKQYDWYGTVSGISGSTDLDVFNGTITDFNVLIGTTSLLCDNDYSCGPPAPMPLIINSSCISSSCSTIGATPPTTNINFYGGSSCSTLYQSGRYDDDVWFTITPANSNPITINVTPTSNLSNFDVCVGVYSGNCSSPTQVACADLYGAGVAEQIVFTPTPQTYLIRVFSYGIGSMYSGDFDICAFATMTGIPEAENISIINIYPNPSKGEFSVKMNSKGNTNITLSISNILGRIVFERQDKVSVGENKFEINLGNVAKGTYFLKTGNDDGIVVKKIIKE